MIERIQPIDVVNKVLMASVYKNQIIKKKQEIKSKYKLFLIANREKCYDKKDKKKKMKQEDEQENR